MATATKQTEGYAMHCPETSQRALLRRPRDNKIVLTLFLYLVMLVLDVCLVLLFPATSEAQSGSITGKVRARGMRHNGDAVVYIEKIPGRSFSPPKIPVAIDQRNLTFIPHVLPVLVGTTVAFPNSDEVRHNVFSASPVKRFNLGMYPQGMAKRITFDQPGVADLLCYVHSEMSAYIVIVETPYFAVTDEDGRYMIENVPPGKYVLKVWHDRLKSQSKEIQVPVDSRVHTDFDLKK